MALNQFRITPAKNGKFNDVVYNSLVDLIGEPTIIDQQNTFANWYQPNNGEIKYHTITLDIHGIHCSVQSIYNFDSAKLLQKTTRRAWYEPGRELLTVTGDSLKECDALFATVLLLIEKKIIPSEFDYYVRKRLSINGNVKKNEIDEATPGKPVGPINSKHKQSLPPPLKTYTSASKSGK